MIEPEYPNDSPLLAALDRLYDKVTAYPMQPLTVLTEDMVLHWSRVLEGLEGLVPRLEANGHSFVAFHGGMETDSDNQLDACGLHHGPEAFEDELAGRLESLRTTLAGYFERSGYRGSSDLCDRMILEISRLSRFLNTWLAVAEKEAQWKMIPAKETREQDGDLYDPNQEASFQLQTRRRLALFEPLLNAAIVGWEENHLESFDHALEDLHEILHKSEPERFEFLPPPGFPLRRRRMPRQKINVFEPEQRPLRSRTVLPVRYQQLREQLIDEISLPPEISWGLAEDVRHFTRMVDSNLFMLTASPSFFDKGRPGVPIIRGRAINHPFLLDPKGFFKHAVLFRNNTYSSGGGALEQMFLQLRQLERLGKFERWNNWARPLRAPIDRGVIAWEENRWDAFTTALLEVATIIRGGRGH